MEVALCQCGCKQPAPVAKRTENRTGAVRGQPQRFIRGHSTRIVIHRAKKKCWRCKEWNPRDSNHFYRDKGNPDGLSYLCKPCFEAVREKRMAKDLERHKRYQREYAKRHFDKKKAYRQEYVKKHAAKMKAYMYDWNLKNAEKVRAYARSKKKKMADCLRNAKMKRRALEAKAVMDGDKDINFDSVYASFDGRCIVCGEIVNRDVCHFDHVQPLSKGGPHTADNLSPSHRLCNSIKGDRTVEYARKRVGEFRGMGVWPEDVNAYKVKKVIAI